MSPWTALCIQTPFRSLEGSRVSNCIDNKIQRPYILFAVSFFSGMSTSRDPRDVYKCCNAPNFNGDVRARNLRHSSSSAMRKVSVIIARLTSFFHEGRYLFPPGSSRQSVCEPRYHGFRFASSTKSAHKCCNATGLWACAPSDNTPPEPVLGILVLSGLCK